jgi:hypothetical protein
MLSYYTGLLAVTWKAPPPRDRHAVITETNPVQVVRYTRTGSSQELNISYVNRQKRSHYTRAGQ